MQSGQPFTVTTSSSPTNTGTAGRADVVPGVPDYPASRSVTEWFNPAAFTMPAAGTFGNAGRNSVIGPGSRVFDMAFTKVIPMGDVRVLEFRAQTTNIFNTPQYSSIDTVINSPTFGHVVSVGSMRKIQAQARLRF